MATAKFLEEKDIKPEVKEINEFADKISKDVRKLQYGGFTRKIVGSTKKGLAIDWGDGTFDIDMQLTFENKKAQEMPATIRNEIFTIVQEHAKKKGWRVENSKSVITIVKHKDKKVIKFDLAIMKIKNDQKMLIRLDKQTNNLVWNLLGKYNIAFKKYLEADNMQNEKIKKSYLERKINQKSKNLAEDHPDFRTSTEIFIEVVNNIIV